MADRPLKSITFPGLADKYMIPEIDSTLTQQGEAADAKKTGDEISGVKNTLNHKADVIYDTASGDIASFPDGADGLPVKDLTVAIEPVQSGTGDPSPTNVRPISGWAGANVANISDSEKQQYFAGLINGTNGFVDLGTLTFEQRYAGTNNKTILAHLPSKYPQKNNRDFLSLYQYIGYVTGTSELNNPDNSTVGLYSYYNILTTEYNDIVYFVIPINETPRGSLVYELATPTTPTITQAQYNTLLQSFNLGGWLAPISWQSSAGTVYGGTLDVTSGVLTVTMASVDLGTLTYSNNGAIDGGVQWRVEITAKKYGFDNILSSIFAYGYLDTIIGHMCGRENNTYVMFNSAITDLSAFTTAVTGQQLVYELATPQTYQLDHVTVTTLLGQNNIWADCGPSTVEYPADTKLYIQKINTPTDDDMIADAQIASGKYFIVNNNLYISTAAILAGDPIKPGTNCTLTNLAAALNAINS